MEAIITISGTDKPGSLARIRTFLSQKGFGLKGQQTAELASGLRVLKIKVEAAQVDKDRLAAEIKSLNPDYNLVSVEGAGAGDKSETTLSDSAAAQIKQMASQFPDIVALVRAYAGAFDKEARAQALFDAGRKLGAFHYRKDWSFGNPLAMPAALRRALVPALEKFGRVEAADTQFALPDNPFCGSGAELNCCAFVTGFAQGFLDAGPASANTLVEKTTCKRVGHTHCTYTVSLISS